MSIYKIMQSMPDNGSLRIDVIGERGEPISDATADISFTGDPDDTLEKLSTDSNGQTSSVSLPAPPAEYSSAPGISQPYSEFSITVRADGYEPVVVNGINIFSGVESIQNISLKPVSPVVPLQVFNIGPHTLYGNYPPKIPESEIKPLNNPGEIVLNQVVVPQTIVVHDGNPSDSTATDYYVPFTDYIKNVACSEIYPTWPVSTITANVIAIISFTLNRVYTEW